MADHNTDRELDALATRLGQLAPRAGRLDRDRVLFLAGQATAIGMPWWRQTLLAAGCFLGGMILAGNAAISRSTTVSMPPVAVGTEHEKSAPAEATSDRPRSLLLAAAPMAPTDYVGLRNLALARGLDALPQPAATDGDARLARRADRMLQDLLDERFVKPAPRDH